MIKLTFESSFHSVCVCVFNAKAFDLYCCLIEFDICLVNVTAIIFDRNIFCFVTLIKYLKICEYERCMVMWTCMYVIYTKIIHYCEIFTLLIVFLSRSVVCKKKGFIFFLNELACNKS